MWISSRKHIANPVLMTNLDGEIQLRRQRADIA